MNAPEQYEDYMERFYIKITCKNCGKLERVQPESRCHKENLCINCAKEYSDIVKQF
jgi:hypothetical protein